MSFLEPLLAAAGPALSQAAPAATALGHSISVDPMRISKIANSVGTVANGIATAGGAAPGYAAPQGTQQQSAPAAPLNNHLQLLDAGTLDDLIRKFGAGQYSAGRGVQY